MLEQAKSYAGLGRVVWREADAMALPFPDEAFEYVICQFGVIFFPDKQTAFREVLRVLRPGGQFLFNVWGDTEGTARKLVQDVVGESLSRGPTSLVAPEYKRHCDSRRGVNCGGVYFGHGREGVKTNPLRLRPRGCHRELPWWAAARSDREIRT
jgi:SAM-dependent methyltransferase